MRHLFYSPSLSLKISPRGGPSISEIQDIGYGREARLIKSYRLSRGRFLREEAHQWLSVISCSATFLHQVNFALTVAFLEGLAQRRSVHHRCAA